MALLLRSLDRAQVAFALFAGFLIAAWVARHYFWTRSATIAWAMPLLAGLLMYALAAVTGGTQLVFQILPIDWATAGVSGALAGLLDRRKSPRTPHPRSPSPPPRPTETNRGTGNGEVKEQHTSHNTGGL